MSSRSKRDRPPKSTNSHNSVSSGGIPPYKQKKPGRFDKDLEIDKQRKKQKEEKNLEKERIALEKQREYEEKRHLKKQKTQLLRRRTKRGQPIMAAKMQVLMMRMSQEFPEFEKNNNYKPYNHDIHNNRSSDDSESQNNTENHSNIRIHPALEQRKKKQTPKHVSSMKQQKNLPSRKISRKKKFKERRLARRAQYSKS